MHLTREAVAWYNLIVSDTFEGIQFPRRLVMLQEHWQLPYFLEALPYTREELARLSCSRGVVAQAAQHGVRLTPALEGEE